LLIKTMYVPNVVVCMKDMRSFMGEMG